MYIQDGSELVYELKEIRESGEDSSQAFEHQEFRLQKRTGWDSGQRTDNMLRLLNQLLFEVFLDTVGGGVTAGVWAGSKLVPLEE